MLSSPEKEIPGSHEDCLYIDERCVQGAGLMAPKDSTINKKSMYNFGGKRGQLTQRQVKTRGGRYCQLYIFLVLCYGPSFLSTWRPMKLTAVVSHRYKWEYVISLKYVENHFHTHCKEAA